MKDPSTRIGTFDRRQFMGLTVGGATATVLGVWPKIAVSAGADTLVVASGAEAVTLDPHVSLDGNSPLLWRAPYETLLKYDGASLDIVPHLAEAYEVSNDQTTYTFHLRSGVSFHDGEGMDAAAVKLSLERQAALGLGISYALAELKSVEAPDDKTVVVRINKPQDYFLSVFSGTYSPYVVSPKAIRDNEKDGDWAQDWFRHNMVGTGPYLLRSFTQAQQAVFDRFPDYWRGWEGNHFERVFVKYISEASTTRLLLEQGEIDVSLFMPDDMVEELDGREGITVTNAPSFNLYYIMLPTHVGPTRDVRVRQAISYGFDYDTWTQEMMRGIAEQARGPLPSNFADFSPDTPQYHYDPEKARALLAEAGYPDGGFTIKYIYETGYWWKRPLGELFQANMRDLGIEIEIQELSGSAWADILSNPEVAEHAFGLVWWPSLNTGGDYMWSMFHSDAQGGYGNNWGYYKNEEVDRLLSDAPGEPDADKRQAMYAEAQKLIVQDAPGLFVYEKNYRLPMRDNVKGFVFHGIYIEMVDYYALHKT